MKRFFPAILLVTAGAIAVAAMSHRRTADGAADDYRPPVLPSRTSAPPPAIPEPPSLPGAAERLSPISFTVTTTWADAKGQRHSSQHVMRTTEAMQLLMEGTGKEWLLERNPVDRRRVSGYLVDHAARQILAHQESDLRNEQQLRGWADAVMMRFDPSVLSSLRRKDQGQTAYGESFTRYVAHDPAREGVMEVWWSEALLLPLRLQVRQRGVIATSAIGAIERVDQPAAIARLVDPRTRFADYEVLDVADSRERRH